MNPEVAILAQAGWKRTRCVVRNVVLAACVVVLAACAHRDAARPVTASPAPGAPYAGFVLGDGAEGGAVVLDVIAGPAALAGLEPGDRIVTANGEPANAAKLLQAVRASSPGARMPLRVARGDRMLDIELVIGDLGQWSPPSMYPPRVSATQSAPRAQAVWLDDMERQLAAAAVELAPERERIDRMLADLAALDAGYHKLPLNRRFLADPGALVAWESGVVRRLDPAAGPKADVVALWCETLALVCPASAPQGNGPVDLDRFAQAIAKANAQVRAVLGPLGGREQVLADVRTLLQETATQRTLIDRAHALPAMRAMRYSMQVDSAQLLEAFGRILRYALQPPALRQAEPRKPPAALAALVEGEILDFAEVDGGYVVYGGTGPNRYAMDRLYAVIDAGGDDRYVWSDRVPLETRTVVDLSGNDRYEAPFGGPGAGLLGAGVLIDLAGDDVYASALAGCGAGAFGFGYLYDGAGNDVYECSAWSVGAGIYGAGVLVDVGTGGDAYVSQSLSQGVGGPAGTGLLVDGGGDDLYRANGPVPSAYGTPASYMAFSQGVGFGIRPYDHGGIGALLDLGGNDRYEGGEFSQGGGYFWGAGLLHDRSGNDFYYGNRYAQGFAAHQAVGLLSDLGGDDAYWAYSAASQGAAWDQSAAMLFDGAGNDRYRGDSLAQGAAAQQSRAWLFDAEGDDDYWSSVDSAQGAATDNNYHFRADDPVVSFGALLDAAGRDRYSTGLAEGEPRIRFLPGNPDQGRGNAGVAIDR